MPRSTSLRRSARRLFRFETFEPRRLLAGIDLKETVDRTIVNDNGNGADYYDISLESQPISDVIIQISTSNPNVFASSFQDVPMQVLFTAEDWSPKRVYVSGIPDQLATGNFSAILSHQVTTEDANYQDQLVRDVDVTVVDTDSQIALSWYDVEMMEGETLFTFFDVLFPPNYVGPSFSLDYDQSQLNISGFGTQTLNAVNDGIEEGVHDVPINFIPDGPVPPQYTVPMMTVRISDPVAPEYVGFQIGGGQAQRSIVNTIQLEFTTDFSVQPDQITLIDTNTDSQIPISMFVEADRRTLNVFYGENFSIERSLADGNYELFVPQHAITHVQSGLPLNQDIRIRPADGLYRLFGDLNGNGTIDKLEVDTFNAAFGSSNESSLYIRELDDLDDGFIGDDDLIKFRKVYISSNTVAEDAPKNTVIGSLTGFSLFGPVVSYQLLSVDGLTENLPFAVQGSDLVVASALDFETSRVRLVELQAITTGGVATLGQLEINVTNVNENSQSPIQLSNDNVIENYIGAIGNLFVPSSSDTWQFSLVSGSGDYDNALFSIEGDQLNILEAPDYELRDNYSIRVFAQNDSQQIEAVITVDIIPVDEFPPERMIFWTEQFGESDTIPYLVENSPVGQPATRIRIVDGDRGDNYTFTGFFGDLATVQGDAFVPIQEINFEAIEFPYSIQNFVTANSASGVVFTNGGNTSVIIDINDPPVVAQTLIDQELNAGEQGQYAIPAETFFDEDSGDFLTLSATSAGGPLPSWVIFDGATNEFRFFPTVLQSGSITIEVHATDSQGAEAIASFNVQVNPLANLDIQGSPGNDLFQITRLNGPTDSWQVVVNNQTVFVGGLANYLVNFVGGDGTDRLVLRGSNQANTFEFWEDHIKLELTGVISDGVEQVDIRGRNGGDQLNLMSLPGGGLANRTLPVSFSFFGDGGLDQIQSNLDSAEWLISGNDSGSIAGLLNFENVESLVGGLSNDYFEIGASGRISRGIDGGFGYNTLIRTRSGGQSNLEISSLAPFAGELDGTELLNIGRIETGPAQGTVVGPTANAEPALAWYIGLEPNYDQLVGGLGAVDLYGFSNLIGRDGQDFFFVHDYAASRTIQGGGGDDNLLLLQNINPLFPPTTSTFVNLQTRSASGVESFSGIESFNGSGLESTLIGPNRNTNWTFDNGLVSIKPSGQPDLLAVNFGSIQAGNSRDSFSLFTEVAFSNYNYPTLIQAGGGQDLIVSYTDPDFDGPSLWSLTGAGIGNALGVQFQSVENLLAGSTTDHFIFENTLNNSQWFDSIETTNDSLYAEIQYLGESGVTVNLQNQTASGVERWRGINAFLGSNGSDLLIGANQDTTWSIDLEGGSASDGVHHLQGFETIQAGSGNDLMAILGLVANPSSASRLVAGQGIDTISFADVPGSVSVSLASGNVSLLGRGIAQFENVIGTAYDDFIEGSNEENVLAGLHGNDQLSGLGGSDVLLGGFGNDMLYGGSGRDLLLGGSGSDWLFGGTGEDLLISGLSDLLLNENESAEGIHFAALKAVMTEWTSNRSNLQRISRLRNGVGPGNSFALNSSTIQSDGELDNVLGEGDDDWFWLGTEDIASDRLNRERMN